MVPEWPSPLGPGRAAPGLAAAVGPEGALDEGWRSGIRPVVRRRVEAFLRDPVGSASSVDLAGTAVGLIQRSGRLPDYIRMLRGMPPREAARRLGHDLGETTGEVGFDVLEALLARKAEGVMKGGRTTGGGGAPRP